MALTATVSKQGAVAYTAVGDVALVLWSGEPNLRDNRWFIERLEQSFLVHRESCVLLIFVITGASIPDAQFRKEIQEAYRTRLGPVRRLVNVLLGDSMATSLWRTTLRAVATIGDRRKVVTVAGTVSEAIELTRAVATPTTPPASVLLEHVHELFRVSGVPL
jgi:hypothetical protein